MLKNNYVLIRTFITTIFSGLLFLISPIQIWSQSSKAQITKARTISNAALKAQDVEAILDCLTDDVLITTGAGNLISGKAALRAYIENVQSEQPMYWVRSTIEIEISEGLGLAWESGVWHGYEVADQEGKFPKINGKYAAMWSKVSGEWKIKSQLFVTLQ